MTSQSDSAPADETRQCRKCGEVKPITRFETNSQNTGRRYVCRNCRQPNKNARRNRKTRSRSLDSLKRKYDGIMADPERRKHYMARLIVQRAIRAGELLRQPCEVCGATMTHGHHDDYSKPLEVRCSPSTATSAPLSWP